MTWAKNWDVALGGGMVATVTLTQVNQIIALGGGLLTVVILLIRLRREWRFRNNRPDTKTL